MVELLYVEDKTSWVAAGDWKKRSGAESGWRCAIGAGAYSGGTCDDGVVMITVGGAAAGSSTTQLQKDIRRHWRMLEH